MFTSTLIRKSEVAFRVKTFQSEPAWCHSNISLKCCVLLFLALTSANLAICDDVPQPKEATRRSTTVKFPPRITPEQLDPWSAIEPEEQPNAPVLPPTTDGPDTIKSEAGSGPPLIIPELIDRPDNIDDQNVAPIPTAPTETVDRSTSQSLNTTIPVVPESPDVIPKQLISEPPATDDVPAPQPAESSPQSVYDSAPRLASHSENASPTTPDDSDKATAGAWPIAWTQIFSTVVGVFIAAGIFLTIRFAAMKLFGIHMGVTFHFGSPDQTTALASSDNESAVTVSFEKQFDQTMTTALPSHSDEPPQDSEDVDPSDSPFRIRRAA